MDHTTFNAAVAAIDAINTTDPTGESLPHAEAVSRWLSILAPDADPALRIAARAQHLERWVLARNTFAMDKAGYFAWRKAVHARQAERATEILAPLLSAEDTARIAALVGKQRQKEADGQCLEDCACLALFSDELASFAAKHPDYTPDRWLRIIERTAKKMSPSGRQHLATLHLPPGIDDLRDQALANLA